MPKATEHPTYPSRRSALRLSVTGTAVGLLAPLGVARAVLSSSPDAKLITLCADLVRNGNAQSAMFAPCTHRTIAEEGAKEPELLRLADEEEQLVNAIVEQWPPETMEGAQAVAAAVMAIAEYDQDGELVIWDRDRPEVLALLLAEAMANGEVA